MPPNKNRNGIPDRWLDYQNVGKRIPGTRFISFKVPLKQALTRSLPQSEVFGPWELLDVLAKRKEELGLIIDLTFTTRYYNIADIPESLLWMKIFTAGHEVPDDATILNFKQAVNSFLQKNKDNDKLIGVHCTHGLNRTGYLVCRYLIDVDGVDPKKAIELFNSSRGHTIERENYLQDLKSGPKRRLGGRDQRDQRHAPASGALCSNRTRYRPDEPDQGFYFDDATPSRQSALKPTPYLCLLSSARPCHHHLSLHHHHPHPSHPPPPPLPPPPQPSPPPPPPLPSTTISTTSITAIPPTTTTTTTTTSTATTTTTLVELAYPHDAMLRFELHHNSCSKGMKSERSTD
ncbi:unnamed protein product [Lota lota]